jgi:hypothetical protein
LTAVCAVVGAPAAGGAVVVSGAANRLGETSVISEKVGPVELASELLVLLAPLFVADELAPGL